MNKDLSMHVSELAQNLMLIGFETSSSRVSAHDNVLTYKGFSGQIEYFTEAGSIRLMVDGTVVYDSTIHASTKHPDDVAEVAKRLNAEMLRVYEQHVLAGD